MVPEPPEGWMRRAGCLGTALTASFYADEGVHYESMDWRDSCLPCPVRAECLAHAIRHREHWGVWGGLSPTTRREMVEYMEAGMIRWEELVLAFEKARVRYYRPESLSVVVEIRVG